MRCRKHHPEDLTSTIGVCASCLSERLLTIIAAQEKAHQARASSRASPTPPPPLAFPRSVSPYVSRRKSDHATWHTLDNTNTNTNNNLFYSTPQLGPTGSYPQPAHTGLSSGRTKKNKFWVLSSLFRSRSDIKLGPHESNEPSSSSSSSTSSWFSTIFTNRKKNIHHDDDHADHRRSSQYRPSDRGMSPVTNESSSVVDCDGCSAETSPRWRKTPNGNGNSNRARRSRHVSHVSGMAFCLSPLVRASPNSNSHWKGMMPSPSEMVSEVRGKPKAKVKGMTQSHPQHRPHLSTASSFCANRSRKLADFGRANHVR